MGAVTAILYAAKDPFLNGIVLDSPFSDLKQVAKEIVRDRANVPKFLTNMALKMVRKSIKQRIPGFDIFRFKPLESAEKSFVPALFIHGLQDQLVGPHHSQKLFDVYGGEKEFEMVNGGHNDTRPPYIQ